MDKNKLIVIIDPGHGGSDPGASGNGVVEKVANLNTSIACKKYLEKQGIKTYITRTDDSYLSLDERTKYENKITAQYPNHKVVFLSIHHNSGGGDRMEAIHSIYYGDATEIAKSIADNMEKELGQQKKVYSKKNSAGNADYYAVIRNTKCSAVIVEVAFLDNKNDVQICDTIEKQKRNGEVIARGLMKWAKITPVNGSNGSGNVNTSTNKKTMYRVVVGSYKDKNNANKVLNDAKNKGFKDAFLVAVEV